MRSRQLAAVRLLPGPGCKSDVVHRLNLKCSDRAILAERRSQKKSLCPVWPAKVPTWGILVGWLSSLPYILPLFRVWSQRSTAWPLDYGLTVAWLYKKPGCSCQNSDRSVTQSIAIPLLHGIQNAATCLPHFLLKALSTASKGCGSAATSAPQPFLKALSTASATDSAEALSTGKGPAGKSDLGSLPDYWKRNCCCAWFSGTYVLGYLQHVWVNWRLPCCSISSSNLLF